MFPFLMEGTQGWETICMGQMEQNCSPQTIGRLGPQKYFCIHTSTCGQSRMAFPKAQKPSDRGGYI